MHFYLWEWDLYVQTGFAFKNEKKIALNFKYKSKYFSLYLHLQNGLGCSLGIGLEAVLMCLESYLQRGTAWMGELSKQWPSHLCFLTKSKMYFSESERRWWPSGFTSFFFLFSFFGFKLWHFFLIFRFRFFLHLDSS